MNNNDYDLIVKQREHIFAELRRLGYQPNENSMAPPGTDLKTVSAQWRIRCGEAPKSMQECTVAVLEALVIQGWIPAHDGDGVSCVAQMIWAQHQRAEKAESALMSPATRGTPCR